MPIRLSQTHLDMADPSLQDLLGELQGNILKGHGRDHSRHVFLRFTAKADACRAWVASFAPQVTSAFEQHRTARDYRATGTDHLFAGFMLTYTGYQALAIDDRRTPDDKAFRAGMKDHDSVYDTGPRGVHTRSTNPMNDDLGHWEESFLHQIDALIVLAYGGSDSDIQKCTQLLEERVDRIKSSVRGIAHVVSVQRGFALRNQHGHVIEHFGFADAVSNPLFLKSDVQRAEEEHGTEHYDPAAPVGLVVVQDPGGRSPTESYGTYFVYRKLQQNIKGFNDRTQTLAAALSEASGSQIDHQLAGALVVGRFKDGTPVSLQTEPGLPAFNDFNFDDDVDARRCPFHAHIRKTNPRGDTHRISGLPMRNERARRIVRRGISYGHTDLEPETEWSDAGLLFLSCQSDIEQQFLVMQCGWCGNRDFVTRGTGLDPVIGQAANEDRSPGQQWPVSSEGESRSVEFSFFDFVRCRGGEFFFAPSISFLKCLFTNMPGGREARPGQTNGGYDDA